MSILLNGEDEESSSDIVQVRVIKDYAFNIHGYNQRYSNGIIDRYYWITISKQHEENGLDFLRKEAPLTPTELRVTEHLYNGLTYRAIAEKMVISYHTLKKHVQNIYMKCGVSSRYELSKWIDNRKYY